MARRSAAPLSESEGSEAEDSIELDVAGSEAEAASDDGASEGDAREAEASDDEASDEEASKAARAKTSMVCGASAYCERPLVRAQVVTLPLILSLFPADGKKDRFGRTKVDRHHQHLQGTPFFSSVPASR